MKNPKILIIEDEPSLRSALAEKLTQSGFDVCIGVDGEEGLRLALTEDPDAIILDLIMPKMRGDQVLEELRKDPQGKLVKVIVLTNVTDLNVVASVVEDGALSYLIKSETSLSDLVDKLHVMLNSKLSSVQGKP